MSDNGGDNQLNKKSPQKPPRPPAPSALSKLPRSGSIQKHMEALQGLKPERIRWFVKEDKKWLPLNGSDSLAVEKCFREILELESKAEDDSKVVNSSSPYKMPTIKGGLYEVDVVARKCKPIYWKGWYCTCLFALFMCLVNYVTNNPFHYSEVSQNDGKQPN